MEDKELKLILLDIADLFVEIIQSNNVYSGAKAKAVGRLIDKIGKLEVKEEE